MGSYLFGGLMAGLILGAIPAIAGGIKGKLGLGLGGLAACVVSGLLLGMLLAIPVCVVFLYFIFKKDPSKQNDAVQGSPQSSDTSGSEAELTQAETDDVSDQIQKLSDLRDAGILTKEEFQQKKEQLLTK